MKAFVSQVYNKLRNSLNYRIEYLMSNEGIVRFGDHFLKHSLLSGQSFIVDLGANKGTFSKQVAEEIGCRILIVEPNQDLLNKIEIDNSIKINALVASSPLLTDFYYSKNPEASSMDREIASAFGITHSQQIRGLPFSSLLEDNFIENVDLLKVDIEGAEIDLFLNTDIKYLDRCCQIAVEFHDFINPKYTDQIIDVIHKLSGIGFVVLKFSPLDHRCMLFIKTSMVNFSSLFILKFRFLQSLSFALDYTYYKLLIRVKNLFNSVLEV